MTAVARGDLRARFTTPKGVTVQALFTGLLYLVAFFGVSPDGAPGRPVFSAISSLYLVMVAYLCAALPSGEIAIPDEKGLLDLVTTRLPARAVGWGKALSGAVFAASVSTLTVPALSFLLALRALPWTLALHQAVVLWAVGWASAGLGTWMGGAVESDLLRSIALWAALIALFGLPSLSGPVQPLVAAQPFAPFGTRAACIGGAVILGLALFGLCVRWTERLRRAL